MKIGLKIIETLEDYKIADVLPEGYEDITLVSNWIKVCNLQWYDYKFLRKRLQEMDFSLLTDDEKIQVCQFKGSTEINCKQYLGETFNFWMTDFDLKSQKCRNERFSLAKTILIKNVSLGDRYSVLGFLNTTQLENNYIKFGIEGTSESDPIEGLFNFIEATGSYISTGINARMLEMIGGITKEEMVTQIMDALKNGTY